MQVFFTSVADFFTDYDYFKQHIMVINVLMLNG